MEYDYSAERETMDDERMHESIAGLRYWQLEGRRNKRRYQ